MEITVEQFKEWAGLITEFTWPLLLVFVLVVYRDAVSHFVIALIDLIFRRK